MGISLDYGQARDVLQTVQRKYLFPNKAAILQTYNTYPVTNQWCREDKVRLQGGSDIQYTVLLSPNGSAQWVDPYGTKSIEQTDVLATVTAPWRCLSAHYVISKDEIDRNVASAEKLVDLLKLKRASAMQDIAKKMEVAAWAVPSGTSDTLNPYGVPYFLVPITSAQVSAATYGQQGVAASGFTDCMGLNPSTSGNELWKSYNDVWSNSGGAIADEDVTKITRMLRRLDFEAPMTQKDFIDGKAANFQLYTCETIIEAMEDRARKNNDRLDADVGKFAGKTVIKGIPLTWVPRLDTADTTNRGAYPLYAINHNHFFVTVREGEIFSESEPMSDVTQHRVFTTHVDATLNFCIDDRQKAGGVISYVA